MSIVLNHICKRKWILSFIVFLGTTAIFIGISFPFGNCQWSKYHYLFQAHYWPKSDKAFLYPKYAYNGKWVVWHDYGGKIVFCGNFSNGKFSGRYTAYDAKRNKIAEGNMVDSIAVGKSLAWYSNGQPRFIITFTDKLYIAKRKWVDEDGNILLNSIEAPIEDWSPFRIDFSVMDGVFKEWFANGQLSIVGEYRMGKKVGKWVTYRKNGEVYSTKIYDKKQRMSQDKYDLKEKEKVDRAWKKLLKYDKPPTRIDMDIE